MKGIWQRPRGYPRSAGGRTVEVDDGVFVSTKKARADKYGPHHLAFRWGNLYRRTGKPICHERELHFRQLAAEQDAARPTTEFDVFAPSF